MATLAEKLTAILKNTGVQDDDATLISIQKLTASLEVPDNFMSGLITIDAAKTNPTLHNHFKGVFFKGLDTELEKAYTDLGLDDATIERLKAEPSSFKRSTMLATEVKKLESEKAKSSAPDKVKIQEQIDALNKQVAEEKTLREQEKQAIINEYEGKLTQNELRSFLASRNLVDSAKEEGFLLPITKLNKTLTDKGLKLVKDNGAFKLHDKDGLEYHENNAKVSFDAFTDKLLADSKYLVVAQQQNTAAPAQQQTTVHQGQGKNTSMYDNAEVPVIPG